MILKHYILVLWKILFHWVIQVFWYVLLYNIRKSHLLISPLMFPEKSLIIGKTVRLQWHIQIFQNIIFDRNIEFLLLVKKKPRCFLWNDRLISSIYQKMAAKYQVWISMVFLPVIVSSKIMCLISRIYKEYYNSITKRQANLKMGKHLSRHNSK